MKANINTPLIAMMYYNSEQPLFINYIAECVKKREELEPDPRQPHQLKIKTIVKAKKFIDLL